MDCIARSFRQIKSYTHYVYGSQEKCRDKRSAVRLCIVCFMCELGNFSVVQHFPLCFRTFELFRCTFITNALHLAVV